MSEARRTAACLAVGSELLGEHRLDSNSLTITRALVQHGMTLDEKRVVGDSVERVAKAIRELFDRHDLVVVTGGLGPTADDVTRDAVARAFNREIVTDAEVEGWIRARYAELGRDMPEICTTMARVVAGSRPLRNNRGSAPGLLLEDDGRILAVFPGVPWEMEEMLERDLVSEIAGWNPGFSKISRTLLLGGVVESDTEVKIRHLYDRFGREDITILASYGVLRLVLSAEGDEDSATRQLDVMEAAFREVLGMDVAAVDVDDLPRAPRRSFSVGLFPTPTMPRSILSTCRTKCWSSTVRSQRRSHARWRKESGRGSDLTGAPESPASPGRLAAPRRNQ